VNHSLSTAEAIDDVSTQSEASLLQQTGNHIPGAMGLAISQEGFAGGSNLFPETIDNPVPYFKMGYSALTVNGTYNTQGQHVLVPEVTDCFGVGDCLIGSRLSMHRAVFAIRPTRVRTYTTYKLTRIAGSLWEHALLDADWLNDSHDRPKFRGRYAGRWPLSCIDTNSTKTITSASTGGVIIGGSKFRAPCGRLFRWDESSA